jgi:hypothetical protein
MVSEWKQTSTAGAGGRVEVVVPGLRAGKVVEVSVRFSTDGPGESRPVGLLKGRIRLMPDFDEPLDEFEPYS